MPYKNIEQLPGGIQAHLSPSAQELYLSAYNEAWENCRYTQDRFDTADSRQVTANRMAWQEVKKRCTRDTWGRWYLEEEQEMVQRRAG